MARVLSQTLTRISSSSSSSAPPKFPNPTALSPRMLAHRKRSNQSGKGQLHELDLESSSSSAASSDAASSAAGDAEVVGVRKLEDVIHSIIVRRSAPDWLPFIPGSSYWVPPRRRTPGIVELVGKLTNPLTREEDMSFSTERGWPSSTYFIDGAAAHPIPLELQVKVEVKVEENTDSSSESEDAEG